MHRELVSDSFLIHINHTDTKLLLIDNDANLGTWPRSTNDECCPVDYAKVEALWNDIKATLDEQLDGGSTGSRPRTTHHVRIPTAPRTESAGAVRWNQRLGCLACLRSCQTQSSSETSTSKLGTSISLRRPVGVPENKGRRWQGD